MSDCQTCEVPPMPIIVPIVRIEGARVVANSRDVADYFERPHPNVLRSIDGLIQDEPKLAECIFASGSYLDENKQERRCFDMDRDGFTLLGMGFTGKKALQFKLAYIAAFNEMEAQLATKAPDTALAILADIRDNTAMLPARFEHQEKVNSSLIDSQERLGKRVDSIAEDVAYIKQANCKRLFLLQGTKQDHIADISDMGGVCPCCHFNIVIVDGDKAPFSEWDHWYAHYRRASHETWLICKPCHTGFTTGRILRHDREAQFRAYQINRAQLPGRQLRLPKLFD